MLRLTDFCPTGGGGALAKVPVRILAVTGRTWCPFGAVLRRCGPSCALLSRWLQPNCLLWVNRLGSFGVKPVEFDALVPFLMVAGSDSTS